MPRKVSKLFPDVPIPDRGVARTGSVGPRVASPMIEEFIGPALADIPKAREAFGLKPKNKRSGTVTGGGR